MFAQSRIALLKDHHIHELAIVFVQFTTLTNQFLVQKSHASQLSITIFQQEGFTLSCVSIELQLLHFTQTEPFVSNFVFIQLFQLSNGIPIQTIFQMFVGSI